MNPSGSDGALALLLLSSLQHKRDEPLQDLT